MTTWEKIKDWWFWTGSDMLNFHRFRNFRRGIYNLVVWFSTIWYDRQWDDYYLYNMLRVKFRRMEEFYGNSKWAVSADADKVAHQCRIGRILCSRIIENDYTSPYEKKAQIHHERFRSQFQAAMNSKSKCITIEDDKLGSKIVMLEFDHKEMLHQQDIDYLCKMISKYSRCWWD